MTVLSGYMVQTGQTEYDDSFGIAFADDYCQQHPNSDLVRHIRVFIARLNAILHGEGFVACRKLAVPVVLPVGLHIYEPG